MSSHPTGALVIALVLAALGALIALFPKNPFLQSKDFGKRFGKVQDNTRSFGIVIFFFGLMFFALWLFLSH